ncbi:MAG: alkaline phosphatase family protein [Aggregatilineales bacterium]
MKIRRFRLALALTAVAALLPMIGVSAQTQPANPINHIVVIYLENHSFDNLYGNFPGANGLDNAKNAAPQVDKNGTPYATLPQPLVGGKPDARFPANLANQPFDIDQYMAPDQISGDLVHRFYQEQWQIDGGKMDKFIAYTDAAGLVMGYYDTTKLAMYKIVQQYTLADNFFHAAFGGSYLNHFWLICACSPTFPNAPSKMVAQLDANGNVVKDGAVTPDGFSVNTSFTVNSPHPANADPTTLVPEQTLPTIGDRLSDKGISWAWYSGGWNDAVAGKPDKLFQFHHQAFAYFKNYADGTDGRKQHLLDETDFRAAIKAGNLPAVSFFKPLGPDNEHPGYAALTVGEQYTVDLISAIQNSPNWKDTAIIITYDENGGQWDHAAPPTVDKWGPGTRVPMIVISPYAKKGFIDHDEMDTTSILAFIENRFGLQPLTDRDAHVNNMLNAFDFTQTPAQAATKAS